MVKRLLAVYTYLSCGLFAFTVSAQAQSVKWGFFAIPVYEKEVEITGTTRLEDGGDLYAHVIAEGGPRLELSPTAALAGENGGEEGTGPEISKAYTDQTMQYHRLPSVSLARMSSNNMLIGLSLLSVILNVSLVWLCNACLLQEGKRLQSTSAPVKLLLCLINGCHTGVVLHYTRPHT
jgi:hypothetical protein